MLQVTRGQGGANALRFPDLNLRRQNMSQGIDVRLIFIAVQLNRAQG